MTAEIVLDLDHEAGDQATWWRALVDGEHVANLVVDSWLGEEPHTFAWSRPPADYPLSTEQSEMFDRWRDAVIAFGAELCRELGHEPDFSICVKQPGRADRIIKPPT